MELGWTPEWRDLDLPDVTGDVPLVLEVPRGQDQERALDDIAAEAGDGGRVVAKFRTGATPTWAWPDEQELAASSSRACGARPALQADRRAAPRGARHPTSRPAEQHGLLNVARRRPRAAHTAPSPGPLAQVLAQRDPAPLVREVACLSRRRRRQRARPLHGLRLLRGHRPDRRAARPLPIEEPPDVPDHADHLARRPRRPPLRHRQPALRRLLDRRHAAAGRRAHRRLGARRRRRRARRRSGPATDRIWRRLARSRASTPSSPSAARPGPSPARGSTRCSPTTCTATASSHTWSRSTT